MHFSAFVDLATEISAILPRWRLKLSVYFHLGEYYWKDFSSPAQGNEVFLHSLTDKALALGESLEGCDTQPHWMWVQPDLAGLSEGDAVWSKNYGDCSSSSSMKRRVLGGCMTLRTCPSVARLSTSSEHGSEEHLFCLLLQMQGLVRKRRLFKEETCTYLTLSMLVLTFSVLVFTKTLCTPHIPHHTILSCCTNLTLSDLVILKPLHFTYFPPSQSATLGSLSTSLPSLPNIMPWSFW